MQFSSLFWLIPMPSRNDGIYWTPLRATEECCNHLHKPKRRAGRYGLHIQSKRSVTITWHMQFSPLVWLIPMPSRIDGIYWTPIRATEECCNHLQKPKRRAGRCVLLIQSKRSVTITWHMQFSPLVWLIPMPSRNDASIGRQSEPLRNDATTSRNPNDVLVDMVCKSSRKGPSQLLGTCSFPH
jgi:hypothetical protein